MTTEQPLLRIKSEEEFLHDQEQAVRASVYELLASLLARQPEADVLFRLRRIGETDASQGRLAMGWELMKQSALKTDLEAVHEEYFNLLIGLGRGELVPFGSWYMTGFLMEKPLAVLRGDLHRLGIERQDGVAESEDHIAALCDAMALIIRHPDEVPLAEQQAFFNDHLSPWAGQFFKDMQEAASAHFYRPVGFFGESFIEFERQLLGMQS